MAIIHTLGFIIFSILLDQHHMTACQASPLRGERLLLSDGGSGKETVIYCMLTVCQAQSWVLSETSLYLSR